MQSIYTTRKK